MGMKLCDLIASVGNGAFPVISSNMLTVVGMPAGEMRRGFFAHAGMVSPVVGVWLRSMECPADSNNVGQSSPNRESAPPALAWAPRDGVYGSGVLG
jgi:hypothetical protein